MCSIRSVQSRKTAADDVLCSLRVFEEPESHQGMKVMVMQKFESGTVRVMKQMASEVCSSLRAEIQRAQQHIQSLLATEELASVRSTLQQGCDQAALNSLLPIAQSASTKQLHSEVKVMESSVESTKGLSVLSELIPDDISSLAIDDTQFTLARTMICELAAVQGLTRPLRKDETRSHLARRARLMIVSKNITVEKNLDLLLNKVAAGTGS